MRSFLIKQMLCRQKGLIEKLEEFDRTQFYSKVELEAYQEEKLQLLIKHAYGSVPFYRDIFDKNKLKPSDIRKIDDLQKLPVLEKEVLRSNVDKLLSTVNSNFRMRTTGGSTGVPLTIANSYDAGIIESALYFRYLRWLGYEWGDRILQLWGEHPLESKMKKYRKRLRRNLYNTTFYNTYLLNTKIYDEIIQRLVTVPPKVIRGYASSIYYLASNVLEHGLKLQINAVSTTAEKLFKFQRNIIEKAFGKNIFDQYGCGETNSIAFECEKHNGLHVASEHVVLEIVNDCGQSSERGNVIVTNLDNYAMPLIRYKNGDIASRSQVICDCKRELPLLKEIEGRVYDFIEGPDGRKIHAGFFDDIFLDLDIGRKYSVKEFRVVQENINRLAVEFVTENDLLKSDEKIIKEKICQYLGNMEIEIKKVRNIPLTTMGKRMFVLSLLNRDKWNGKQL